MDQNSGWQGRIKTIEKDFSTAANEIKGGMNAQLCAYCKGSKKLCGKDRCPVLTKYYAQSKTQSMINSTNIAGSSPPGVFVGRYGYPKVLVGPLVPAETGDTMLYDTPERWIGKSIEDIVDFRMKLVRGMKPVEVTNVENGGRVIDITRELAMGSVSSDVEATFTKKPRGRLTFNSESQPYGPTAPIKGLDSGNIKIDQKIDKAYSDTDLLSKPAVINLYKNGIMVSRIQKAFSVGAFGIGKNRKFVPTRWSITAVDDMLGKDLMTNTKHAPFINDFEVYWTEELDNRWAVLMMPCSWRYELIEAWYPNTVWNPYGRDVVIFSDYEFLKNRTTYAKIGGCYYSARLAVNENLTARNRQAGCVIFREAHAGYIMPVGVWNVRENVRAAVRNKPRKFNNLKESLDFISTRMDIPMDRWIKTSGVLKDMLHQRRIEDFLTDDKPIEPDMDNTIEPNLERENEG